jgi:hypothetical protein
MTSATAPVSTAAKQQHHDDDDQDQFHGKLPLTVSALYCASADERGMKFESEKARVKPDRLSNHAILWVLYASRIATISCVRGSRTTISSPTRM